MSKRANKESAKEPKEPAAKSPRHEPAPKAAAEPEPTRSSEVFDALFGAPVPAGAADSPTAPTFSKGSARKNESGMGIDTGFNLQCIVMDEPEEMVDSKGHKLKLLVYVEKKISSNTFDTVSGGILQLALPVEKRKVGPQLESTGSGGMARLPRDVNVTLQGLGSDNVMVLSAGVFSITLWQKKDEVLTPPPVGSTILIRGAEACKGAKAGKAVFLNGSYFEISHTPDLKNAELAVSNAFNTRTAHMMSAFAGLTTFGGVVEGAASDAQRSQLAILEGAFAGDCVKVGEKLRGVIYAIEAEKTEDHDVLQRQAASKAALVEWVNYFDGFKDAASPFVRVVEKMDDFLVNKTNGLMLSGAVVGATPHVPMGRGLRELRGDAAPLDGPRCEVQVAGFFHSPNVLKVALRLAMVGDGRKYREEIAESGDAGLIMTKQASTGFMVSKLGKLFVTNYKNRASMVVTELMPTLSFSFQVPVKPAEVSSATEMELNWATFFRADLRGTLDSHLPKLSRDEVVSIFGNATVVTPSSLASSEAYFETDKGVTPTTFAKKFIIPLQEMGTDLDDLEKVADKHGLVVKYVALYPGAVQAVWRDNEQRVKAEGVEAISAYELLKERAGGAAAVKDFVTTEGVVYAIAV
jgi:hypothetical protein